MNRIFITGDLHLNVDIKKLSFKNWPMSRELDHSDVLIVCGDAGLTWNDSNETKYWCDWLESKPYTTICCAGNHEGYHILNALPSERRYGGLVHVVRPHIMYSFSGEVLNINDKTFFFQNGAASTDKAYRKEGVSWWSEEIPSYEDFEYGEDNLRAQDMKVDYIISHTTSNRTIQKFDKFFPRFDAVTNFLDKFVEEEVDYKINFFGHFHQDRTIDEKHILLYNDIIEILPDGTIKVVNN